MNRHALSLLVLLPRLAAADDRPKGPPPTRREPVKETLHGVEITDPYRWLEDGASPATRAWIAEQQKCTQSLLGELPGRAALKKRITQLLRVDTTSAPAVYKTGEPADRGFDRRVRLPVLAAGGEGGQGGLTCGA